MRKLMSTTLLIVASAFAISCHQVPKQFASAGLDEQTITVQCHVDTDEGLTWKWTETKIRDAQNLDHLQFLNSDLGFASGEEGSLYKTTDGGARWQKLKIEVLSNEYIAGFQFVGPTVGWLVLNKNSHDTLMLNGYESRVMFTSDGGGSWLPQYSDKALQIWGIRFVDDHEGWAVGRKFEVKDTHQDDVFVLHTTDQGKHWVNISKQFPTGSTIVSDVYASKRSKALMLSDETIFSTVNGGKSWQTTGRIQGEPPQTAFLRIYQSLDNRIWVLGGADSREGMWMIFARLERDNSWKKYKAGGVYLRDAVFLSENEVLACGRIFVEDKSSPLSEKRDGVILYSSDGGQNWAIVYRSREVSDINALSVGSTGNIVAVGNDGLTLRFRRAG